MPTFTAITLDRLIEPRSRDPPPRPPPVPMAKTGMPVPSSSDTKRLLMPSPALYATPESTPLPDSPASFPPSPYIVNHKRRGPRLLKSFSQNDVVNGGGEVKDSPRDGKLESEHKENDACKSQGEGIANGVHSGEVKGDSLVDGIGGIEELADVGTGDSEKDKDCDDFFDPQDSMSTSSNADVDDSGGVDRMWKPGTPLGEYFDALEEISSEGTTQTSYRNVEDELRQMRLTVLMEIEKRKQAEEALENLQNQWRRLSYHLSLVGLMLPSPPTITEETNEQINPDPAGELYRQIIVSRLVAGSMARGCSRAEVELEMEPQIESKNFEIARLCDRLQYYEAANREMSQRNQEAVACPRSAVGDIQRIAAFFFIESDPHARDCTAGTSQEKEASEMALELDRCNHYPWCGSHCVVLPSSTFIP